MSEFLLVRLPGDHTPNRRVCIDGTPCRPVGTLIELEGPGDYIVTLTSPQNYSPPAQQVLVYHTTADLPQIVTFVLDAIPVVAPVPAAAPPPAASRPAPVNGQAQARPKTTKTAPRSPKRARPAKTPKSTKTVARTLARRKPAKAKTAKRVKRAKRR